MSLIIEIKVVPSAGKQAWILDKSGRLKCFLKSPPERGLANAELITMLAKALRVTQQQIEIITGQTSRIKKVKIMTALTFEQLLRHVGIDRQTSLLS